MSTQLGDLVSGGLRGTWQAWEKLSDFVVNDRPTLPVAAQVNKEEVQRSQSVVTELSNGAELRGPVGFEEISRDGNEVIVQSRDNPQIRFQVHSMQTGPAGQDRITVVFPLKEGDSEPARGATGTVYIKSWEGITAYDITWSDQWISADESGDIIVPPQNGSLETRFAKGPRGLTDHYNDNPNNRVTVETRSLVSRDNGMTYTFSRQTQFSGGPLGGGDFLGMQTLVAADQAAHAQRYGNGGWVSIADSSGQQMILPIAANSGRRVDYIGLGDQNLSTISPYQRIARQAPPLPQAKIYEDSVSQSL